VRGKILGQAGGSGMLELAVILLFWFFDTPSRVYAQASAAPACPLPLVPYCRTGKWDREKW